MVHILFIISSSTEQEVECQILIPIVPFKCLSTHVLWKTHLHKFLYLCLYIFFLSIILDPLFSRQVIHWPITLILSCDLSVLRIIWFRSTQKRLQRDQSCSDCQSGCPFVLQNIQANCSSLGTDVWMPYLCVELHLWRLKWVVLRNLNVYIEDASFVRGVTLIKFG